MTDAEWTTCDNPEPMLKFLGKSVSPRKIRLFGVACCRRIAPLLKFKVWRVGVEVAERYADGLVEREEWFSALRAVANIKEFGHELRAHAVMWRDRIACEAGLAVYEVLINDERLLYDTGATVLRHAAGAIRGRAYKLAGTKDDSARRALAVAGKAEDAAQAELVRDVIGNPFRPVTLDSRWLSETVIQFATGVYLEKAFDRLPILADALEDEGCDSLDLLNHLRGNSPHVRGCWSIDLILGKS